MARLRKRLLSYSPVWGSNYDGYITNFLAVNFWRVAALMEYQDAVQEAQLVFVKLVNTYGNVDKPQHFMALFKTSWVNRFNDLSKKATRHRRIAYGDIYESALEEQAQIYERGVDYNDGMLSVMMQQAPAEIKSVLRLFLTAPVEVLDTLAKMMDVDGQFNDKHLCQILGLKKGTKIKQKINNYFQA